MSEKVEVTLERKDINQIVMYYNEDENLFTINIQTIPGMIKKLSENFVKVKGIKKLEALNAISLDNAHLNLFE